MVKEKILSEGQALSHEGTRMVPDREIRVGGLNQMIEDISWTLQVIDGMATPQDIEEVVSDWEAKFRDAIPLSSKNTANEFGVSRARIHEIKKKVNPDNILSNWQTLEAIREYRQIHHRKEAAQRRKKANSLSAIAREFFVTPTSVRQRAINLKVKDTKNLTSREVEKIRTAFSTSERRGPRPKNRSLS